MRRVYLISLLLTSALFLGSASLVSAQEDTLSLPRKDVEESVFNLKMQGRYIPGNMPFRDPSNSNSFLRALENTSISLAGGYNRWLDKDVSSGPMASLSISKWLSARHGFRVEGGIGYFLNNETGEFVQLFPDIRASHLFNLSAFLNGYDPLGPGYLYTLGGLGYGWRASKTEDGAIHYTGAWNAQLGIGYSVRVARGWNVFVEPVFELNGNKFLPQEDGNWRGYYGGFRGNVGLSYRIDRWNTLLPPKTEHAWFVETAGGPAWLSGKAGYHVMLGVGEVLSPAFSLRLSGAWTQAFEKDRRENSSTYGALRLDAMVDLLGFSDRPNRPLGLSLMAGPETGIIGIHADEPTLAGGFDFLGGQAVYVGASAGMQLRARIYKRFSAIVEPRVSFIPYTLQKEEGPAENNLDFVFSTNVGVQYAIRSVEERWAAWERTKQRTKQYWKKAYDDTWVGWEQTKLDWERTKQGWQRIQPGLSFFASLEGSYFRPLGREYANGPLASLSLGGWFNPVNGMLVNAGLGYFQDLRYNNGYVKTSEFTAAYLFNISRFIHKDESGPLNLSLLAGAGYMLPIRELWKGSAIFRTGLDLRMHLLTRTDLVVRPEIDILKAPSDFWTPALRGTLGLSYNVGGTPMAKFDDIGKEWKIILGGGYQNEIVRLTDETRENAPIGEYRINLAVGRRYTSRLDWRLSASYLSQISDDYNNSFKHRLRFASVNIDALYNLLGDDLVDRRWSLSLVGGPEIGLQHKANKGENIKGSGLILHLSTVSAYLGLSAGVQAKYRITDGLAVFVEPKYSLAPYVAKAKSGDETAYSHIYGTNFGLEYSFKRNRYWENVSAPETGSEDKGPAYTFVQLTATAFSPFGSGYANGPLASIGIGHWFNGPSGVMVDFGAGYFRDNLVSKDDNGRVYPPQHMATLEGHISYMLSLSRLASRSHKTDPLQVSLISGIGYIVPEFRHRVGSFSAHAGFDLRMHMFPGTDMVIQPQLELFRDPHSLQDGSMEGLGGAFRGTVGLSYNLSKWKRYPYEDPGKDWFFSVSAGVQNEIGRIPDKDETETNRNEYRIAIAFGRTYAKGISVRATGSYSEVFPQVGSFLHSLRYTSANLEMLYDLLANERGDNRVSLSILGGPEAGFFNKEHGGHENEYPLSLPFRMFNRSMHGISAYIGLSVGAQLRVRVFKGLSLYLEPRYSMVPYVAALSGTDHRNMTSHLWNASFGIQYNL